ncbi:hypothetical protein EVAR_96742_1 [Eumeta japonica]|uniref:Uncharacterized protein n=1 Tax=Eumeta variegata TaxID=151549 RepID=A0A4C1Y032_EUMVA|nr:hypothetical protein EVAR_96742_1 [Eumeta japonica]
MQNEFLYFSPPHGLKNPRLESRVVVNSAAVQKWAGSTAETPPHHHRVQKSNNSFCCTICPVSESFCGSLSLHYPTFSSITPLPSSSITPLPTIRYLILNQKVDNELMTPLELRVSMDDCDHVKLSGGSHGRLIL